MALSLIDLQKLFGMSPGTGEALLSILSGTAGQAAGGLAGLGSLAAGRGAEKSVQTIQDIQNALTYQPRTEAGGNVLGGIARVMQPLEDVKRTLGESVQDAGYGPGVATAAHMIPDLILSALPFAKVGNLKAGPVAGSRAAQIGAVGGRGKPPIVPPEVPTAAEEAAVSAEGLNKATRAKRVVGTTGQYVGAPPGIDSPAKFNNLINQYVDRIDESLNAGVPRGYFYERGAAANKAVTDSPEALARLALTEGVTSSEAPVLTNTGWAIKGMEQNAMGAPISTGKYPNAMRDKIERVMAGDTSHIGEKTHRYAGGLAGDVRGLAPNDRWEIRSFGYPTDTAGPAQHAFMDEVRQRAAERWSGRNPDHAPLSILEAQELNWATQRARDMNVPHIEASRDVVHDALSAHTIQHSWESRGGQVAGHLQDMPESSLGPYHQQVADILLDPTGKDRLIRGMGGELQFPAVHGPGVYEGNISPGTQSRSLGYMTNEGGLDPVTGARVGGTEAMRAWLLGQDAYAYHGMRQPSGLSGPKTDILDIRTGSTINAPQALAAQQALDTAFGAGNTGVVPTATGFRALRLSDNPKFAKVFQSSVGPTLEDLFPMGPKQTSTGITEVRPGARVGDYQTLDWPNQNATSNMLEALKNPAAPKLWERANSPEVRDLAAQLAGLYDEKVAGGLTPNPRLPGAVRAFATGGLPALEELVKKGLAPAFGAAGLYGLFGPQDEQQGYQ